MLVHELYLHALDTTPDKLAVVCQHETLTYRQLHRNVNRFTRSLLKLGVKRGDRVGLFMQNIPQYVEIFLACSKVGAVVVNVSCYASVPAIAYILNHSRTEWLFYGNDLKEKAGEVIDSVDTLKGVYPVDTPPGCSSPAWMDSPDGDIAAGDLPEIAPDDISIIIYTSGSTSTPKGAVHTHYSMTHCAIDRKETLRLTAEDSYLSTAYLCHAAAFMVTLFPMLYVGGTALFPRSYTIDNFMELLLEYAPTMAASGPAQLWEMLEHPKIEGARLSQMRYFSCGGDVVPMELHRQFAEVFGFPLSESIGMTECSTYLTTPYGTEHRIGSMGKPVTGAYVRLIDENGCDVATGECGEIIVKATTNMKCYWDDEGATEKTIKEGWIYTGDIGRQDEDGYYYFAGRKKMMIVRNTCNIPPVMIEAAVNKHPGVKTSCVIGVPDRRIGQRVVVFVEPEEGRETPTTEELSEWITSHVYEHMCPDEWIILKQLPATAIGKTDREELQRIYNELKKN